MKSTFAKLTILSLLLIVVVCVLLIYNTSKNESDTILYRFGRVPSGYGYVSSNGKLLNKELRYQYAFEFENGYALVAVDDKRQIIDKKGNYVLNLQEDERPTRLSSNIVLIHKIDEETDCRLIQLPDTQLKIPDSVYPLRGASENRIVVRNRSNGKEGYIDLEGNLVIPTIYDYAGIFSEGLASVTVDNKDGYIDIHGEIQIPFKFELADAFRDGLAEVKLTSDHNWQYINRSGEIAFDEEFLVTTMYSEKYAVVLDASTEKYGLIDTEGQWVVPPKFSSIDYVQDGMAGFTNGDVHGYLQLTGKDFKVIRFQEEVYQKSPFYKGRAFVDTSTQEGLIDKTGNWVWILEED